MRNALLAVFFFKFLFVHDEVVGKQWLGVRGNGRLLKAKRTQRSFSSVLIPHPPTSGHGASAISFSLASATARFSCQRSSCSLKAARKRSMPMFSFALIWMASG